MVVVLYVWANNGARRMSVWFVVVGMKVRVADVGGGNGNRRDARRRCSEGAVIRYWQLPTFSHGQQVDSHQAQPHLCLICTEGREGECWNHATGRGSLISGAEMWSMD